MDNVTIAKFTGSRQEITVFKAPYQWSYGQLLRITGLDLPDGIEVHFSLSETTGLSYKVRGTKIEDYIQVGIPQFIFEKECTRREDYKAYVFIYHNDTDSGSTTHKIILNIKTRPKPDDYIYSDEEIKTYKILENRINHLEESAVSKPDWNQNDESAKDYIKNRPLYTERKVILEETTFNGFVENGGCVMCESPFGMFDESLKYTVIYDGVEYTGLIPVVYADDEYGIGGVNADTLEIDPSIAPFALATHTWQEGVVLMMVFFDSDVDTHTVKIIVEDFPHRIDKKFLPEKSQYIARLDTPLTLKEFLQLPIGFYNIVYGIEYYKNEPKDGLAENLGNVDIDYLYGLIYIQYKEDDYIELASYEKCLYLELYLYELEGKNQEFILVEGYSSPLLDINLNNFVQAPTETYSIDYDTLSKRELFSDSVAGNTDDVKEIYDFLNKNYRNKSFRFFKHIDIGLKYLFGGCIDYCYLGDQNEILINSDTCRLTTSMKSGIVYNNRVEPIVVFLYNQGGIDVYAYEDKYNSYVRSLTINTVNMSTYTSYINGYLEAIKRNNLSYSHAEGSGTASGGCSHAEGWNTKASGDCSHAEGSNTKASGCNSHAEGFSTEASGESSHAEGNWTNASGLYSHAEGDYTKALEYGSHAEGCSTKASGYNSHAEGWGTTASSENQHVQGKNNLEDTENKYAHIVGNGTNSNNSNAHTLDWDGVPWYQGRPQFGGYAQDDEAQTVMANGDTEIILTSSTEGSEKQFMITVDDNGTLTATLIE